MMKRLEIDKNIWFYLLFWTLGSILAWIGIFVTIIFYTSKNLIYGESILAAIGPVLMIVGILISFGFLIFFLVKRYDFEKKILIFCWTLSPLSFLLFFFLKLNDKNKKNK